VNPPPGCEIARLTAPEVAARIAAGAPVVLPLGSLETHGPQAPMGDFLIAAEIARRIAEAGEGLVLPAIPFGGEDFFAGIPGGIELPGGLLQSLVEEVLARMVATGCRRLLVVNGHAGSIVPVEAAARALRRRLGVVVPSLHLWRVAGALHAELGGPPSSLGHGGDPVYSVALHLVPELCRPERAGPRAAAGECLGLPLTDFGTLRCGGVAFSVPATVAENAPGGVACADSRDASAERGAAITERLVAAGAAMLRQLRAQA
jgi:creatinine amidohydrolase